MALPFAETEVTETRSLVQIVEHLTALGFDEVYSGTTKGVKKVFAHHKGATFQFEVIIESVKNAFISEMGERTQNRYYNTDKAEEFAGETKKQKRDRIAWVKWRRETEQKLEEKAGRAAWRLIANQVKSLHDSIRMGVITISQAFGGHLIITDRAGKQQYMSTFITEKIESGEMQSGKAIGLLTDPKNS